MSLQGTTFPRLNKSSSILGVSHNTVDTNGDVVEDMKDETAYKVAVLLWQICPVLLFLFGTVGNALILVVLRSLRLGSSSMHIYLRALAVSDLLVLYSGLLRQWIRWTFGMDIRASHIAACRIHTWLVYVSIYASAWLLVMMTLERTCSACLPHRVGTFCTRRRATFIITFIVVFQGCLHSHFLFGMTLRGSDSGAGAGSETADGDEAAIYPHEKDTQHNSYVETGSNTGSKFFMNRSFASKIFNSSSSALRPSSSVELSASSLSPPSLLASMVPPQAPSISYSCEGMTAEYDYFLHHVFPLVDLCLLSLLPFFCVIVGNVLIVWKTFLSLKTAASLNLATSSSALLRRRRASSMTAILLAISALFLLTTSPTCVYNMWERTDSATRMYKTAHGAAHIEAIWACVNIVMYCNNTFNFYLYCLSGRKFRSEMKRQISRRRTESQSVVVSGYSMQHRFTHAQEVRNGQAGGSIRTKGNQIIQVVPLGKSGSAGRQSTLSRNSNAYL